MRGQGIQMFYVDNFDLLAANLKNLKTTKYTKKIEMNLSNLKNGSNL